MKKSSETPFTDKKHGGGYEEFNQINTIQYISQHRNSTLEV